jgi:hypothetical protein
MDGSSAAVIFIPIVTMISLALWLVIVLYPEAHPRNRRHRKTRATNPEVTSGTLAHNIPLPRSSSDDAPGSGQVRPRGSTTVPGPPRAGGRRALKEDAEPREGRDEKYSAYTQADKSGEEDRLVRSGPADRKAGVRA